MNSVLALQTLLHDRTRFAVTLVGIVFAVVLMSVQLGLFVGFATTTSSLIDRSGADLWIAAQGAPNVDQAAVIGERKAYLALAVPGVERAELLVTQFANWQRPDGGVESVVVVGLDTSGELLEPWNLIAGDAAQLKVPGAVIIDQLYAEKLGITQLGQIAEVNGHRARVVGLTSGIRSFTQSPYVFASLKSAQQFVGLRGDQAKFVLLRTAEGADRGLVQRQVAERVPDVEVFTREQFSLRTQFYWMLTTGAGLALLVAAAMGVVVGLVVAAQTLYATTVDHLREFATLRAMGAPRGYVQRVIVKQALFSAAVGFAIGHAVTVVLIDVLQDWGPAMILPWRLVVGVGVTTLLMCVLAGLISIRKVNRLDPASVFQ